MIRPLTLVGLTLLAAPARAEFDAMVIGGAMICAIPDMMAAIRTTTIEATGWTRVGPADRADAVALLAAARSPSRADFNSIPLDVAQAELRQELSAQAMAAPGFGETEEWFLRQDGDRTHALLFMEGVDGPFCMIATTSDMSRAEVQAALLATLGEETALPGGVMVAMSDAAAQGATGTLTFPDAAAFQAVGLDAPGILIVIGPGSE
jgi:hypothetical protein